MLCRKGLHNQSREIYAPKQEIRASFQMPPREQVLSNEPQSRSHYTPQWGITRHSLIGISMGYLHNYMAGGLMVAYHKLSARKRERHSEEVTSNC